MILLVVVMALAWIQLWFAYLSKFEDNVKTVLGNTLRIAMSNIGRSILMAAVVITAVTAFAALILISPPFMALIPGVFILIYTAMMRKLFDQYILAENKTPHGTLD